MVASSSSKYIIRDGVEQDIRLCLGLDHTYETDHVWQMHVHHDDITGWEISLRQERLPRTLEITYPSSAHRLTSVLEQERCFLVAEERDTNSIVGYLALTPDPLHKLGLIHDLLVSRPIRRKQIGLRLIGAARTWAKEHNLSRLTIETQTKNLPSVAFCQAAGFIFSGFNDRYYPNQDVALFFSVSLR